MAEFVNQGKLRVNVRLDGWENIVIVSLKFFKTILPPVKQWKRGILLKKNFKIKYFL